MTQEQHPITPPSELVNQWIMEATEPSYVPTQAARWGADQELEACCELLDINGCPGKWIDMLHASRRPKPPSLKEQALKELHHLVERLPEGTLFSDAAILRAIESLPD